MEVIKFRAWDTENKKFVDLGAIILDIDGSVPDENRIILMQFTGIHDKNGKEIWEGDIIFCDTCQSKSVIKWEQKAAMFCFHRPNVHMSYDVDDLGTEVLGNIYENPELLNA